jgi:hypothetical protein
MDIFRKFREQAEADRAPGGVYDQMANYEGSPEYQAMLERNGGVAPGGSAPAGQVFEGPRGGKYTKAKTKSGKTYRRYF